MACHTVVQGVWKKCTWLRKRCLNSLVFFPKMCWGFFFWFVCWVFFCHLLDIIASVSMLVSYVLKTHQAKLFKRNFVQAIFSRYRNLKAEPVSMTAFLLPSLLSFSALWHGSRRQLEWAASGWGCSTKQGREGGGKVHGSLTAGCRINAALPTAFAPFPSAFPSNCRAGKCGSVLHHKERFDRKVFCVPFWNLPRVRLWSLAQWHAEHSPGSEKQSRVLFSLTLPALLTEDLALPFMLKILLHSFSKSMTFCALYKPSLFNTT